MHVDRCCSKHGETFCTMLSLGNSHVDMDLDCIYLVWLLRATKGIDLQITHRRRMNKVTFSTAHYPPPSIQLERRRRIDYKTVLIDEIGPREVILNLIESSKSSKTRVDIEGILQRREKSRRNRHVDDVSPKSRHTNN